VLRSSPSFAVPPNACDCHVHVFGPVSRFPYAASRTYTPADASVEELEQLQSDLHLGRVVLVQPSVYGADNAAHVDAARRLGAKARIVAVIDAKISDAELEALHRAGTRGIRVNLHTAGIDDPSAARRLLRDAAARIAGLGWHVQTYAKLQVIAALRDEMAALPVPLVIDHFGGADAKLGPAQAGFDALLDLARSGKAYVKLSAPYRSSVARPDFADVKPLAQALIDANPDRMVWGSDWPHPGGSSRTEKTSLDEIEPFFPEDDGHTLNLLPRWAPDAALRHKILVDNPARLYGY
jgi:predicted TIM-barrel fold metal-dependent hydrolase